MLSRFNRICPIKRPWSQLNSHLPDDCLKDVRGFPVIVASRTRKPAIRWILSAKIRAQSAIVTKAIAIHPMYAEPLASFGVTRVKRLSETAKHKSEKVDSDIIKIILFKGLYMSSHTEMTCEYVLYSEILIYTVPHKNTPKNFSKIFYKTKPIVIKALYVVSQIILPQNDVIIYFNLFSDTSTSFILTTL